LDWRRRQVTSIEENKNVKGYMYIYQMYIGMFGLVNKAGEDWEI